MKTRLVFTLPIVALALGLAACGGETPPPGGPAQPPADSAAPATPPPSATPEAKPATSGDAKPEVKPEPPPAKKTAKEIIEMGGTYMFSLADSADAKKLASDECEKKAKKDAKKLEACMKEVETAAAGEGIRFEKDAKGNWLWVSFGMEKDKEVIYIKAGFKIAKEDGAKITVTPEGKAEGKMAKGPAPKEMQFEIGDESVVKMTDPMGKKGVLVYKKK